MNLPLFLLNTNVFPGAVLPLHVFEDRYKLMISECLRQKSAFGVVLIRSGSEVGGPAEPCHVGTTARITHVQRLPEGRMNLMTAGLERFRIVEIVRDTPFYIAKVELLASEDDAPDGMAERVGQLFAEYYRLNLALSGQWVRRVPTPASPAALSDFVAARIEAPMDQKQTLLEMLSVAARLTQEESLLSAAISRLQAQVKTSLDIKWRGVSTGN